jgi:hypothetical protein
MRRRGSTLCALVANCELDLGAIGFCRDCGRIPFVRETAAAAMRSATEPSAPPDKTIVFATLGLARRLWIK